MIRRFTSSNRSAALARFLTGIICDVRIRRSAGEHRTRLTSANRRLRRHWPPNAMPRWCCDFVDSRLRRSPPDRASAVPYGQAGENAMRSPHLAHRLAAAHKLHSTTATTSYELDSGKGEPISRLPALAYSPRKLSKRPAPSQIRAGLTHAEVAEQAGLTQQYVSLVEGGRQNITLSTMIALARVTGHEVRVVLRRVRRQPE